MSLSAFLQEIPVFVKEHHTWAPLIAGALAFGESLAIVSLIIPATGILLALGALIGASDLPLLPIWIGAAVGAALGDWLSYWVGLKLENSARNVWPLSRYPHMIEQGEIFFKRWGVWSIFIGRFFGPVRAIVPLIAGTFEMPWLSFQIANWTSAFVWAFVLLAPGFATIRFLS
jgi:membrane protein DedA with SNARE-associated domain